MSILQELLLAAKDKEIAVLSDTTPELNLPNA